ncbi:7203_t:CDS:1, partial [Scutellospora calospora]
PEEPILLFCDSCNNCLKHKDNGVGELVDVKIEIFDILKIVETLYKNNDKIIVLIDIVDIFVLAENKQLRSKKLNLLDLANYYKPKILNTEVLVKSVLADLVCYSLVKQFILLDKKANTDYLTCNLVIEKTAKSTNLLVQKNTWLYWIK